MMARLIADVGPAAGKALVATHVDSWENGSQNWTARMREEFQARRGYDLLPFLPVMTGRVVGSLEVSERFLWDLRRTISELVVENYAGHLRRAGHRHGLRFTIEAYGSPCDDLPYAGQCDEPMGEFWVGGGADRDLRGMASAAHYLRQADRRRRSVHRRRPGALAGPSGDDQGPRRPGLLRRDQPLRLPPLRDAAVDHDDPHGPGMTMGPWGTHYERTQTWWELTPAWHQYLARCQFLLRQGQFVADMCYLQAEDSPQGFQEHPRHGYDWDQCSPEVVLTRMRSRTAGSCCPTA